MYTELMIFLKIPSFIIMYLILLQYHSTITVSLSPGNYRWEVVACSNCSDNFQETYLTPKKISLSKRRISNQNIYISITTISSRIKKVKDTIISLLEGDILPTQIFLMISDEPYLMDDGIPKNSIPLDLLNLANHPTSLLSIVYTNNTGPHRKLLPVLSKFWNEDCVIITVDDDKGKNYPRNTVSQLLKYYILSNKDSVVALRTRRIGVCQSTPFKKTSSYHSWPGVPPPFGYKEMLALPTGTGGILYRPKFFHPIIFDPKFRELTNTGDDLAFRLATLANRVYVITGCREAFNGQSFTNNCPKHPTVTYISNVSINPSNDSVSYSKLLKSLKRANKSSALTATSNNKIISSDMRMNTTTTTSSDSTIKSTITTSTSSRNKDTTDAPTAYPTPIDTDDWRQLTEINDIVVTTTTSSTTSTTPIITTTVSTLQSTTTSPSISSHNNDTINTIINNNNNNNKINTNDHHRHHYHQRQLGLFGLNKEGNNDKMWQKAVRYLKQKKIIDLTDILNEYTLLERRKCLENSERKRICGVTKCYK